LPVPRFVSLKSQNVNMRIGPGKQFKVAWKYVKKGLPMEIIQEYENWRKVRDPEGTEGWILHSLLSGKRTVIINPGELKKASGVVPMYNSPSSEEALIARLEPGVVGQMLSCQEDWCQITAGEASGYVEKKKIWGVYPDELIEE
jgi:SH3-like domain-containing protein